MKKLDLNALRIVSGGCRGPAIPPVTPTPVVHGRGGGGGGSLLSVNARVS
jgi:hypothetical protein